MLVHERTVPGLSDGGAHCTMVADFDYPTFLLSYWGRDAGAEERLPVELVVKQQCADTAALLGFSDRGILVARQASRSQPDRPGGRRFHVSQPSARICPAGALGSSARERATSRQSWRAR